MMKLSKWVLFFCFLVLSTAMACSDETEKPKDNNGEEDDPPTSELQGFLHAKSKLIFDGNDEEIHLRGVGLGGWMVLEGYMLGTHGAQHKIREYLESLAGKAAVDKFFEDWLDNFVKEADIKLIADWGYNSIRLPMHYELFFDENGQWIEEGSKGLMMTDELLEWCAKHKLYLILDLHAAPGGQGNIQDISDRRDGESLWEDVKYQDMTVVFWRKIAERYAEEKWIGGYDLLNEPNYDFENTGHDKGCTNRHNTPMLKLYERIIDAIREVDPNHLIIIEGNCMGSNYRGLESLATYDPKRNLAFSFHHYWIPNDQAGIQSMLNLRNTLNVPLWRGEIGENSNAWFTDMAKLMLDHRIGWANWPWKKINTLDGPIIMEPIPEWNKVRAYRSNSSNPRPTAFETRVAMEKLIVGLDLSNCRLMHDVSYAYINSPMGEGPRPFKQHTVPGRIHFTDYDYGQYMETWYDTDYQNISGQSTNHWNIGGMYRNDGIDIWTAHSDNSPESNGYFIGAIEEGEWMKYTMTTVIPDTYRVLVRFRSNIETGKIALYLDGVKVHNIVLPNTGNAWTTVEFGSLNISNQKELKVLFESGGFDVAFVEFKK